MAEGELTPKELGGFRILRRLASGATSDVLLARAEGPHGFQRIVALKILLAAGKADPDFERRFAVETEAYARLSHPAVVKLHDSFSKDGQAVMVLELVDGLPLHKLRAMLAISGERIEDKAAVFLAFRVFSALAAAHATRDAASGEPAPFVHGDVNPSNILVPWDGQAKLGDFGIAKVRGEPADAHAGFIKGTYGYGAPEQVAGGEATVRADIYSAGLILWELLARRKAVQRGNLNDAQVLKAMTHPEFPALELLRPDLDHALRAAVRQATDPDPEKRTISAEEVIEVLTRAASVDEGREMLAQSMARLRPAGTTDAVAGEEATLAEATVDAGPGAAQSVDAGQEQRLNPDQTAPFDTLTDDSGDHGKVALPRSTKLPTESAKPTADPLRAPDAAGASPDATPSPTAPRVAAAAAAGAPLLIPSATPPRPAPRPAPPTRNTAPLPAMTAPTTRPNNAEEAVLLSGDAPVLAPVAEVAAAAPPPAEPSRKAPAEARPTAEGGVTEGPHTVEADSEKPEALPDKPQAPPDKRELAPNKVETAPDEPEAAPDKVEGAPIVPETVPDELQAVPDEQDAVLSSARRRRFAWEVILVLGIVFAAAAILGLFRNASRRAPAVAAVSSAAQVSARAPRVDLTARQASAVVAARPPSAAAGELPVVVSSTHPVAAPSPSSSAQPTAPVASSPPPAVASAASVSVTPLAATGSATSPPPDSGQIVLPASAAGHRIFIDGKVASEGTAPIRVRCGSHLVRIGSAGEERKVAVPCGGSVSLGS